MPESVLKTSGLTKHYYCRSLFSAQKIVAVDSLDLDIVRGEIFAFLGPNGAGKTTTLSMIIGVTEPTSGKIEIFGEPFCAGDIEPLKKIGYCPEVTSLPGYFTVMELLDFYAQIFDIPPNIKRQRIEDLLEMVGLHKERNMLLRNLSIGQLRLVDFIQALINDPDLILLDEPTVYLDPVIMERFRSILQHLRASGKTVVISSHMLPEIERFSDRLAIIDKGRLLKVGEKDEFLHGSSLEEEFLRIVKEAKG